MSLRGVTAAPSRHPRSPRRPPCASAIARTIARPRPVPPRVRAASPRAKRSNARSARSGSNPGPWSATSSSTPPSIAPRRARSTISPRSVPERVVHEVAQRLPQAELVRLDPQAVAAVHPQVAPMLARPVAKPGAHALEQRPDLHRLAPHRQLPLRGARHEQQILGELREVVALLERGHERLAHLLVVAAGPQGGVELGPDHRDRRAQLVARVGHEAPLALERAAQAVEHLVERLARAGAPRRARRAAAAARRRGVSEISPARRRIASTGRRPALASRYPSSDASRTAIGPPTANDAARPDSVSSRSSSDWPTAKTAPSSTVSARRRTSPRRPGRRRPPGRRAPALFPSMPGTRARRKNVPPAPARTAEAPSSAGPRRPPTLSSTSPSALSTCANPSSASSGAPAAACARCRDRGRA